MTSNHIFIHHPSEDMLTCCPKCGSKLFASYEEDEGVCLTHGTIVRRHLEPLPLVQDRPAHRGQEVGLR